MPEVNSNTDVREALVVAINNKILLLAVVTGARADSTSITNAGLELQLGMHLQPGPGQQHHLEEHSLPTTTWLYYVVKKAVKILLKMTSKSEIELSGGHS